MPEPATRIRRWRATVDFYAEPSDDLGPQTAATANLLRVLMTTMFPCGVVEGFPVLQLLDTAASPPPIDEPGQAELRRAVPL